MISRSLKRCRHGVVRTKGPIVWVSNSTSLRVMFMAAPHRADWCQNSLTRHPFGKVRNTSWIDDDWIRRLEAGHHFNAAPIVAAEGDRHEFRAAVPHHTHAQALGAEQQRVGRYGDG